MKCAKAKQEICYGRCENAGGDGRFARRAQTCSRGRRTCRADSDPLFPFQTGVFFVPFPLSRRLIRPGIHTRYLDVTPPHMAPGGIPSDRMPPFVGKRDCESNQSSFYR